MGTFVRKPAPPVARVAMGAVIYGVVRPVIWGLEKTGRAARVLSRMSVRQMQAVAEKNPFRGYVPGRQDVFVATYAKSGTNWMMQIAHQLIYHGMGEFDHIHSVVPWPDTMASPWMRKYAIPLKEAGDWETSPERKRVIKTHFNWELLPYSEDARYIIVIRDPKDIFVSSYFFLRDSILGPAMPSVDTWYKLFMSEGFPIGGSWAANTAGYWAQRARPNVLVVSFKAMKRDLQDTVCKVARFLEIQAPEQVLNVVREKSTFQYMKGIDHKFGMGQMVPWRAPGAMIRKGTQGGSSELLGPERQREMDTHFVAELKRLGSDFPYEEFCDLA
jgi:hypothetical protein